MSNRFTIHSAGNSFNDGESSGTDSPMHLSHGDPDTIFELDETAKTYNGFGSIQKAKSSERPPMGRLRREAPKTPLKFRQQVEFPGQFVMGFRAGHVDFNIPGILQDSLKPTDSMEVKINLPTPDVLSYCSNNESSFTPHSCKPAHPIALPTSSYNNRFNLPFSNEHDDQLDSKDANNNINNSRSPEHSIGTSQTNYPSSQPFYQHSAIFGSQRRDHHEPDSLSSFHFRNLSVFQQISTDSGLHSNFDHTYTSNQASLNMSSRFSNFGLS